MELNIAEAQRYLGVTVPDEALTADITALAATLQARITPRFVWAVLPPQSNDELSIKHYEFSRAMLADCTHIAVLAASLGAEFDLWVRREQARNMGRAAMLGQMTVGFPVSPLTASTFLLIGLAGVDLGEHQKKTIPLAWAVSLIMLVVAVITGAVAI